MASVCNKLQDCKHPCSVHLCPHFRLCFQKFGKLEALVLGLEVGWTEGTLPAECRRALGPGKQKVSDEVGAQEQRNLPAAWSRAACMARGRSGPPPREQHPLGLGHGLGS